MVGDKLCLGYDVWIAPFGSHGAVIEIIKKDNRWQIVKVISSWIS